MNDFMNLILNPIAGGCNGIAISIWVIVVALTVQYFIEKGEE